MNHANQIAKLLLRIERQIRPLELKTEDHAAQFGSESDLSSYTDKYFLDAGKTQDEVEGIVMADNECDLSVLECIRDIRKKIDAAKVVCRHLFTAQEHLNAIHAIYSSVDEAMRAVLKAGHGNDRSDISFKIINTHRSLKMLALDNPYNLDICRTLVELESCFEGSCYIAVMCLCGRIMEAALKMRVESMAEQDRNPVLAEYLESQKPPRAKTFDALTLQQLVELSKKFSRGQMGWLTPGLEEGAKLVQLYRNMNAHARNNGEIAFPSEDNATTVISVILDLLRQTSESLSEQSNGTMTATSPK